MGLVMGCSWICKFILNLCGYVGDDVLMISTGRLIRATEEAIRGVPARSMWVLCVGRWWHAELGMDGTWGKGSGRS